MTRKKQATTALVAALIVLPWAVLSTGLLQAQSPPQGQPAYQYVGVDQTIARVELATGRIEILAKRGETRASLLIPDRRPWRWREVPIDEQRPQRSGEPRTRPQVERPPVENPDAGKDERHDDADD